MFDPIPHIEVDATRSLDDLQWMASLSKTPPHCSTLLRSITGLGSHGQDLLRPASVLAVAPIPASLVRSIYVPKNQEISTEQDKIAGPLFGRYCDCCDLRAPDL